ncbi:hypothetical protein Clacol_003101 [Clathrus columnatus]|uniref:Brl1/Brr6 domain-containing protein n=1 Tax=Clathrus columnatus TaxID=1419009 RepID=A0AAV5A2J4_9AGAM|nr:hypothetical protein Clacol_003101 [Clathrus columnatus]
MNVRYERRSTEAPMDFEFTDKNRNVIGEDSPFRTPLKHAILETFGSMSTPAPAFSPSPFSNRLGTTLSPFNQPPASTTPWSPRSPLSTTEPDIQDVSMEDASPYKNEPTSQSKSAVTDILTKYTRSKHKSDTSRRRRGSPSADELEDDQSEDGEEDDELGALTTISRRRRPFQKSLSEPLTTTTNHNHHYTFTVPTPQLSHSEIPYLLLGYLQFFFNLSLVLGLLYLTYGFFRNVQKDVEHKMMEHKIDILQEISACNKLYTDNFCADKPSPIILGECEEWRRCMARDANIVKRTSLLAELIGETIDSFMEPISWRTMIFTLASLAMGIILINSILMFYRARHAPDNITSPPVPNPLYHSNSLPYWPQATPAISGQPFTQEPSRRALSVPPGEENLLRTPSRRRKLSTDEDAAEGQ